MGNQRLLCPYLYRDLASSQHPGSSYFCADRMQHCGKMRGGGLCVYINDVWCSKVVKVDGQCSPDVEFLMLRCQSYYLLREFTSVFVVAVDISPDANLKNALQELYEVISSHMTKQLDGIFIVAGDFNQRDLRSLLPKFHQHVHKQYPGPQYHLEHLWQLQSPPPYPFWSIRSYFPACPVKVWTDEATAALQGCFKCRDWHMFRDAATQENHINLEEYTPSVSSYISKCVDDVVITKTIKSFPNQKAWMKREMRALSRAKKAAFRSGDKEAYNTTRVRLKADNKKEKQRYQERLERDLNKYMWQAIQNITGYKSRSTPIMCEAMLPDEHNSFYARFDLLNKE